MVWLGSQPSVQQVLHSPHALVGAIRHQFVRKLALAGRLPQRHVAGFMAAWVVGGEVQGWRAPRLGVGAAQQDVESTRRLHCP